MNHSIRIMSEKINTLIVDDHKMFRDGIRALLEKESNINVMADAETLDDILNLLNKNRVDVILMDIDLGTYSGIEATAKIKKQFPNVNVLAISMHGEHNYIIKMIEAGATGYMLKNAGKEEMLNAIKSVAKGDSYFSKEVSAQIFEHLKDRAVSKDAEKVMLTNRETEILKLIAQEYSNPEIADMLFISIRTVDTHRRNLIEKLGVKNTAGLVRYALKNGLVE